MITRLFVLLILSITITSCGSDVYVCTGPYATKYHSTTDCPEIEYGIKMNRYGYSCEGNNNKIYPYFFCSKCMDGYLIKECESRIIRAFNEQKTE